MTTSWQHPYQALLDQNKQLRNENDQALQLVYKALDAQGAVFTRLRFAYILDIHTLITRNAQLDLARIAILQDALSLA